LKLVIYKTEM